MKLHVWFVTVLFWIALLQQSAAFCQAPVATINLPSGTLVPGTIIQIPIKLNGTDVGTWQLLFRYNRNALTYKGETHWSNLSFLYGFFGATNTFPAAPGDTLLKAQWAYTVTGAGWTYTNQTIVTFKFMYNGGDLNFQWANISTGSQPIDTTFIMANPDTAVNVNTQYGYTYPPFIVGSVAASQTICYNNTPALLTSVPPTGGVTPYLYQWQSSADNTNFIDIPGASDATYQPGQLTANTWYRQVQISSGGSSPLFTESLAITVNPPAPACAGIETVDYGGVVYHTVKIGTQCWLKENLNIGTRIDSDNSQSDNDTIEKYCYNDLDSLCNIYGGLYQWDEMMQYLQAQHPQGICPNGWHIPSDADLTVLSDYLGGSTVAGGSMKEIGTNHWQGPNTGATNCSGFTALPGGAHNSGTFEELFLTTGFWSSSADQASTAWYRELIYTGSDISRLSADKLTGYSVRCVLNSVPVNNTLENITVPQGETNCFDALQTITLAGNNTVFVVENGGGATLIAGQKIICLPGTLVEPGGYFHGYIAPSGPFCQIQYSPVVKLSQEETTQPPDDGSSVHVFPNPTTDNITVELINYPEIGKGRIEVINGSGIVVKSIDLTGTSTQTVSLSSCAAGVYYLRIISATRFESARIIKL